MGLSVLASLDLKYLHCTTNRHGKKYYAVRIGGKRIKLHGEPGSKEFMDEYHDAIAEAGIQVEQKIRYAAGSMTAIVNLWYASGDFKQLRDSTRVTYRGIMDRFLAEHGEKRIAKLERKHIQKIIGEMAEKPAAANNLLARLKQICRFALENDWIKSDPTQGVRKIRYRSEGFYTWTEEDAKKFVETHKPGSKAHLAFMLLSNTGLRRSDLVKMGRGNIRGDTLVLTQQKNSEPVVIPIAPALAQVLATVKDRFIFLQTEYGKPHTAAGFGNKMRAWCDKAGLPDCSAHGLRKLVATRLAEAGCNENTISAILGWANNKQASHYTKAANREKMARQGIKAIS